MKRKIFSVLFALVLVLSFSLVTAVPVAAADPGDIEFSTAGDGIAEWSTEQAYSGSYSVKFHTDTWDWTYKYAVGIPVDDIPLNELTELSYWRNGVSFLPKIMDYAPPAVLLCIDANNDGKLDFDTDGTLSEDPSLMGDDAIFGIGADWVETDIGWIEVNGLTNSYWMYGGVWTIDKTGYHGGWVTYSSLQEFTGSGPIDPTDHVMLVVIAGGNPDGDVYIDDLTINGIPYEFEPPPIEVNIDIKPGSDPNSINPKSKGVIPVAILTTPDFDATTVDWTTVMFEGAIPAHDLSDPLVLADHQQDVDGDGDVDFVFHFRTQETGIAQGDTSATLTGQTTGGIPITGTDTVNIVPKGKGK